MNEKIVVIDPASLESTSLQQIEELSRELNNMVIINPYSKIPNLSIHSEKKKTKPCTYHEYTQASSGEWICRHCKHPLSS